MTEQPTWSAITIADLRGFKAQLDQAEARLARAVEEIEQRKTAWFNQGVAEPGARQQEHLARRVRDLEQEAQGLEWQLVFLHKQQLLVDRLIHVKETEQHLAALERGPLAGLDWPGLLRAADTVEAQPAARAATDQLDRVLEVLEEAGLVPPQEGADINVRAERAKPYGLEPQLPKGALLSQPDDASAGQPDRPPSERSRAARVLAPDLIELADGRVVRYLGLIAPQAVNAFGQQDPGYAEALEMNRALVEGREVRLERDVTDRDAEGRLLRYVYVGKTFVNAELVRWGHASAFSMYPDEKHAVELARLEETARKARRGMWR